MISLKTDEEVSKIAHAGKILANALSEAVKIALPGVTTKYIDEKTAQYVIGHGARCAFLGYRGYPGNICISINEEVVHGIPGSRKLKQGDLVSIDLGVEYEGFYADAAITIGISTITPELKKLISVTRNALFKGIEKATIDNRLSDISFAIQNEVEANKFSVVRELVGHGTGFNLHEDPQIPNFGEPHTGPKLKAGMVLAIEPMVNIGTHCVELLQDGWTYATKDKRTSAHFEHTIAVTNNGPKILTQV